MTAIYVFTAHKAVRRGCDWNEVVLRDGEALTATVDWPIQSIDTPNDIHELASARCCDHAAADAYLHPSSSLNLFLVGISTFCGEQPATTTFIYAGFAWAKSVLNPIHTLKD